MHLGEGIGRIHLDKRNECYHPYNEVKGCLFVCTEGSR